MLKLGIDIGERGVSRFMPPRPRKPPSQTWRTFLDNHFGSLASIDFFTVPTATFRVLYVFFVLAHDRRCILHFNVTEFRSAAWTAQQIIEAFPEDNFDRAKAKFATEADGWMVAYSMVNGTVVVTNEQPRPESGNRVLLPDACTQFEVPYHDTFFMLRELSLRFDLAS